MNAETPAVPHAGRAGHRRLLCERVTRNVADAAAVASRPSQIDPLEVSWRDCTRRTLRARTRGGREVALLLPRGSYLRHGDVVHEDEAVTIVVEVPPCEVWVVGAGGDAARRLAVAVELGNLHTPVEVTPAGELIVLPDGPVLAVLRRHGLSHHVVRRRFAPLRATAGGGVTLPWAGGFRVLRAEPPSLTA